MTAHAQTGLSHPDAAPRGTDVVVVGGGHAGIEAAAAAARLGARVTLITHKLDAIGRMSCNPSIGGLAKGQLVREVDALGGLMARVIDATGIHFRTLNESKGPAVRGPRVQADREAYARRARELLEAVPNVTLLEAEVARPLTEPAPPGSGAGAGSDTHGAQMRVVGVELTDGRVIRSGAVVLCAGTFMRGILHCGPEQTPGGRHGDAPAVGVSKWLLELGFELGRLKTGTSPRVDGRTIDFAALEVQRPEDKPRPVSFATDPSSFRPRQLDCYIAHTNERTHATIREHLHLAPARFGAIKGSPPRYCPSIEDKVDRYPDRASHQIFVEPEGFAPATHTTYLAGFATSLPASVQQPLLRAVPGFERAVVERPGYAVEYDFLPAWQVDRGLMARRIAGFFLAGQLLGTSGYEEAAAQGLIAGANAARWLASRETSWEPWQLGRDEAYIGVLIDDLITKVPTEPYRMFTSRAEHRLLLRADNADRRLAVRGHALGLIDDTRRAAVAALEAELVVGYRVLDRVREAGKTLREVLRRPEETIATVLARQPELAALALSARAREQLDIECHYAGYLDIQRAAVARARTQEAAPIPPVLDYALVPGLRNEARERLAALRPDSLGQAGRIAGVTPADVANLTVYLAAQARRRQAGSAPALRSPAAAPTSTTP